MACWQLVAIDTRRSSVRKVLVVANRTACDDALVEAVRRRAALPPVAFQLVVPATPEGLHRVVDPEVTGLQATTERLDAALPLLSRAAGHGVSGSELVVEPLRAIHIRDRDHDQLEPVSHRRSLRRCSDHETAHALNIHHFPYIGCPPPMADISGTWDARFEPVRDALAEQLERDELGASLVVDLDGTVVVDIWGGWRDLGRQRPWQQDTITNVWSTTKTITNLAALMPVERGQLDVYKPVATYWPEFAAGGKDRVEVRHLLSHNSGVSGWDAPFAVNDMYDW
jgi:hypothetical protein